MKKLEGYHHTPIDVSKKQTINLLKLATKLLTLPREYSHFDMGLFNSHDTVEESKQVQSLCGAAACAIGWGPAAGIKTKKEDLSFIQSDLIKIS